MKTVGYLPKATKPKDDANKPAKPANGNGNKGGNKPANGNGNKGGNKPANDGAGGDGNKPKDDAKTATGDTADSGKDSGAK